MVNNLPATQENWVPSLGCEDTLEKGMEPTLVDLPGEFWVPGGSRGKESACNTGDPGSIPWLGRSPGEGNGNSFQYSCLRNRMDRWSWQATVHGVVKTRTWLSDSHRHTHIHSFTRVPPLMKGASWEAVSVPHLLNQYTNEWEPFTKTLSPSITSNIKCAEILTALNLFILK